ncbi:MAG: bifunctional biotin--[acetyl-CoA-carboxylase] ligase/biotin operon repressor BirA [Gammaproteobacteria bacterium]|nr:bifunctional biotin--[acetyl-CoA-carboxylase] ligase/biotin operon repressor BirA [Gammaproteobacteria bacterium]
MKKLSPLLKKLVAILNDGEFHSGNDLGETLKVSRAAIWKNIKQLIDYGLAIESLHGKGYRLAEALIILDEDRLKKALNPGICSRLEVFATMPSTQDYIKQNLKDPVGNRLCLAEQQTMGRGRLGRSWFSDFGRNICLTYLWQTEKDLSQLGGLSLVVGLSLVEAIKASGIDIPLKVKWPNDIICHDKKMAGILIELTTEAYSNSQVMIGIGLNVNAVDTEDKSITQAWTSLRKETHKALDRNEIVLKLMPILYNFLNQFEQQGLESFMPLWQHYDYLQGKTISLITGNTELNGKVLGINGQGLLSLQLPDGKQKSFASGEASIKK